MASTVVIKWIQQHDIDNDNDAVACTNSIYYAIFVDNERDNVDLLHDDHLQECNVNITAKPTVSTVGIVCFTTTTSESLWHFGEQIWWSSDTWAICFTSHMTTTRTQQQLYYNVFLLIKIIIIVINIIIIIFRLSLLS